MFGQGGKSIAGKNQCFPGGCPHAEILTEGYKGPGLDIFAAPAKGTFAKIDLVLLAKNGILRTDGGALPDRCGITFTVYFRQASILFIQVDRFFRILAGLTALLKAVPDDFQHVLYLGYGADEKLSILTPHKGWISTFTKFLQRNKKEFLRY